MSWESRWARWLGVRLSGVAGRGRRRRSGVPESSAPQADVSHFPMNGALLRDCVRGKSATQWQKLFLRHGPECEREGRRGREELRESIGRVGWEELRESRVGWGVEGE